MQPIVSNGMHESVNKRGAERLASKTWRWLWASPDPAYVAWSPNRTTVAHWFIDHFYSLVFSLLLFQAPWLCSCKNDQKLLEQKSSLGSCWWKLTGGVCQIAPGYTPLHTGCTKEKELWEITGKSLLASATLSLSSLSSLSMSFLSLHLWHKHLFTVRMWNKCGQALPFLSIISFKLYRLLESKYTILHSVNLPNFVK